MIPGGLGRTHLVLAVIVLVAVGGAAWQLSGAGDAEDDTAVFVRPASAFNYNHIWAVHTDRVEMPERVEMQEVSDFSRAPQMMAAGEADVAVVSNPNLGFVTGQNPDARIVRGFSVDGKLLQFVVRNDSDITSVADLAGRKVVVPTATQVGNLALMALEDQGVSPSDVMIVNKKFPAALALLQSGDVAAGLVVGSPAGMEALFSPQYYWEQKMDAEIMGGAVMVDGPDNYAVGHRIADTLNASMIIGQDPQYVDEVVRDFQERTGKNMSHIYGTYRNSKMIALTEDNLAATQQVLDYMYDNGYMDRQVDLSSLAVRDS